MTEEALTVNELAPDAQDAAVGSFAQFYLEKYTHEGLDVFAQIDTTGHIADINQWLVDNVNFLHEEKLHGLIQSRSANFVALLQVLKAPFNRNGQPLTSWSTWFADQIAKIPQGR
ncbi:hypothetical protein [Lacticaseibacillus daqingensis]|uniref:hypothetical protein n=1 Tax=Lacticaseibacillus daqingensis TaxID=2486014 RepID=UPI000F77008C|nr:hypothetical protein [Lacticaseibacillus daqingensis]